jgi:hypothetical protein
VSVDTRLGLRLVLHDTKVCVDFGSARACAGNLITVEIDHADVVWSHKTLGNKCRRAEHDVVADANSDVTSVTIDIAFVPDALTDVANPLL